MLIVVEGGLKRPAEHMQSKVRAAANLCCTELRALPRVFSTKSRRLIPRQELRKMHYALADDLLSLIAKCTRSTAVWRLALSHHSRKVPGWMLAPPTAQTHAH